MMMRRSIFLSVIMMMIQLGLQAQQVSVYHPDADAKSDLTQAIEQAKAAGKHVFITVGGNWCSWCVALDGFLKENKQLDSLIHADFIPLKINYSREVPNKEIMQLLEYPNRFGFPVIVILDDQGKRIHTQNTAYLELGKSYDEKKLMEFFKSWNYAAVHPDKK